MSQDTAFVIAVDQGTTATKIHKLDTRGEFTTLSSLEHRQFFPNAGWVEHDARELLRSVSHCHQYLSGAAAAGIANQGETVVAWNGDSGEPICNAIVWQDNRTAAEIERLKSEGVESLTLERAGLPLDPYFSASKLRWILEHVDEARRLIQQGKLRFGTSDAFFNDRLCGRYVTDVTTASRTSLMNMRTLNWDEELCRAFRVPSEALPTIVPTVGEFGTIGATGKTPLKVSIVDQQAALFGHGCRAPGQAKVTFGTGAFALTVTGSQIVSDPASGMLPTVAWQIAGGAATFALEGGVYNAGSAVNWVRKLGLFTDYSDIDRYSGPTALERGIAFVPALSGLACPYWDRSAAGMWLGLGLEHDRHDLCRAMLEGIAMRTAQVLRAMARRVALDGAISIDGGLSRNQYFCGFLARALGMTVRVPGTAELTGYGVAQLALSSVGLGASQPANGSRTGAMQFVCDQPLPEHLHELYGNAVQRCRSWR